MYVTAALAWWNERPEDLVSCIEGIANVADRVVALDGSYARYPEATVSSCRDEYAAIVDTATRLGLDHMVLRPSRLWRGQVEKRNVLYAIASVGSDFMVVVDADHIIHADRSEVRTFLETTNADVINVPFETPVNPVRSLSDSAVGVWHEGMAGSTIMLPHIYRALPNIRVESRHWCISALKDGQRVWLWNCGSGYPDAIHTVIPIPYRVEHRALFRTAEQIRMSRGFLNDREMVASVTGQEDDRDDLPRPVFTYEQNRTR